MASRDVARPAAPAARRSLAGAARPAVLAALLAACAGRPGPPPSTGVPVQPNLYAKTRADPSIASCDEQTLVVQDGLTRLADRYLWEEIERLIKIHAAGAGAADTAAGRRCAAATQDALATAAQRWAEQGAESGGEFYHPLARKAFAALREHFPPAAEAPLLRYAMGRVEAARGARLAVELGERTLVDEAFREAHTHHRAALAGGLPPEIAARAARGQLEALQHVREGEQKRWVMSEQTCTPDPRGRCTDPVPRVAPVELSPGDREWLAAYDAFLAQPALRDAPDAAPVHIERAHLLMLYRRWDDAESSLRAVLGAGRDDGLSEFGPAVTVPQFEARREEARTLLLGLLVARWMESASADERERARQALIAVAAEIEAGGGDQVAHASALRRAAMWAQAEEAQARSDERPCGVAYEALYAELGDDASAAAEAAEGAGRCYERAGMTQKAIDWLERLADVHRDDPRAPEAVLRLAELHERILNDEQARDRYLDLIARAPRHENAAKARRRSLLLALRAGTLPEGQIDALVRGRAEERSLAAAIQFRAEVRPGAAAEAIERYIDRFGRDGGPRRLAIAHARAAAAWMRASCPVEGAEGLCAEFGRDRTPAKVVARLPRQLSRAREHLERAQKLLPEVSGGKRDVLEIPLAVDPEEARAAARQVALLQGDLDAESALTSQPPKSLDPTRSRAWLDVRRAEVERMSAVYESASAGDAGEGVVGRDRAAALIETRKAQVYESDLALLTEVAAAVETAGDAALAAQMRELAAQRREAVFTAYARCIDFIAAWGHDPDGRGALCRAGLGRIAGRYEEPLEYAPDAEGRVPLHGHEQKSMSKRAAPKPAG